ncbi:ubinuclein-1 isoform X1 [Cryptomeria japonica]|uniref:ubinuclein-1 isoform X1 n=1 Tax=Cryptomeria japonica TaxID=3369 RepID=UPI0027DA2960|nr:ubinuclein-1 isoform X1 [Cryptomeria japonica]
MADNKLTGLGAARQRFHVELKPDETTFVSWKKLVKDLPKAVQNLPFEPPAGAHPALQARIAPEATTGNSLLQKDPVSPPANRFSAVIEKIERLYKGDESSEEEQLDKGPDDDQYDTEDSFIDDTELDEYFSVDKAKTKHTGFFVNRGKLEPVNEPASPVLAQKKRKRKDIKKVPNAEDIPKKLKMGTIRIKAAARTAPLVGMNVKSSAQDRICLTGNEYSDDKASKKQELKSTSTSRESSLLRAGIKEAASKVEPSFQHLKACDKSGGILNGFVTGYKDSSVKGEIIIEPSDDDIFNYSSKYTTPRADCQTRESVKGANDVSTADKTISIDRAGEDIFPRDLNSVGSKLSVSKAKSSPLTPKEAILARPKCTILEKAIQDLEKGVVELCPPTADARESEQSFQGVKKRLPREVKQKLGKVARLASKQGKISDEVIGRLMGILGHVMRLKTLKRNLKEMVESGISAKQEKEGRIQDIKREVTKMVQMQVSSLQAQDGGQKEGLMDDFQGALCTGEKGKPNGSYKWDNDTEDAICNLYDQYVEGMDEHKGPQIKKLYIELAELWPQGWMDNNGIKHAVYRAKERKKKLTKLSNGSVEMTKRKKASAKSHTDGSNGDGPTGSVSNPNYEDLVLGDKQNIQEQAHTEATNGGDTQQFRLVEPKSSFAIHGKQRSSEKGENKDSYINDVWNKCEGGAIHKKERKPKPDIDLNETYTVPIKTSYLPGKEMHKLDKQGLNGLSVLRKGSTQVIGLPMHEEVKID